MLLATADASAGPGAALRALEEARDDTPEDNRPLRAAAELRIGELCSLIGRYEHGLATHDRAREIAVVAGSELRRLSAATGRAWILLLQGRLRELIATVEGELAGRQSLRESLGIYVAARGGSRADRGSRCDGCRRVVACGTRPARMVMGVRADHVGDRGVRDHQRGAERLQSQRGRTESLGAGRLAAARVQPDGRARRRIVHSAAVRELALGHDAGCSGPMPVRTRAESHSPPVHLCEAEIDADHLIEPLPTLMTTGIIKSRIDRNVSLTCPSC